MTRGRKIVEQVMKDGTLIDDYDVSLSPSEIEDVLKQHFEGLQKADTSPVFYLGEYKNNKYAIRCKNVTYLGNPHPKYKKRIQIADDLFSFYKQAVSLGRKPLLLGIYTYEDNRILVNFSIDTYIKKKAHNSSAHIYSSDLVMATEEGFFEKIDYFGNTVTAFCPENVNVFLDEYFRISKETSLMLSNNIDEMKVFHLETKTKCNANKNALSDNTKLDITFFENSNEIVLQNDLNSMRFIPPTIKYSEIFMKEIVPKIESFFQNEPRKWYGIDCYKKMIQAQYKNKFQPEWVGFFLEYEFERYISENNLLNIVRYHQDKSLNGIDLDLFFPQIESYGDLKAHSKESRGIQGNDWETVFSIINGQEEKNHIYYIVCEHATEKDSLHNYKVTKFWNQSQNKSDLMSYHKRMKNNVTLKKVYILDINYTNCEYLTMFKQGINSNGKPRAPKIMIEKDKMKYFLIAEIPL